MLVCLKQFLPFHEATLFANPVLADFVPDGKMCTVLKLKARETIAVTSGILALPRNRQLMQMTLHADGRVFGRFFAEEPVEPVEAQQLAVKKQSTASLFDSKRLMYNPVARKSRC